MSKKEKELFEKLCKISDRLGVGFNFNYNYRIGVSVKIYINDEITINYGGVDSTFIDGFEFSIKKLKELEKLIKEKNN